MRCIASTSALQLNSA